MNLPPYNIPPTLSSDTLLLRLVESTDIENLIPISFYDGVKATNFEEGAKMQEKINVDYQSGNSIHWVIIHRPSNVIVGTCGYYRAFAERKGELGCILLPQYQGKGLMTEALQLAIEFGIKKIGLTTIWAETSSQNHKAIALLEKLKFTKTVELDEYGVKYTYTELNPLKNQ